MRLSRSLGWLSGVALGVALLGAPAQAQVRCPEGSILTQANCGGDRCECAPACDSHDRCRSGCCHEGYCAITCVCETAGATVTQNCGEAGGCGTVAPTSAPFGGQGVPWGMGLFAIGAVALGRFSRQGRVRKAALLASAALCLTGVAVMTSAMTTAAPISEAKALRQ